ncbi:MAG: CDP-alcohol phosphatidyltransferase family protein [Patulibacter sp.]|nr:CDP-alcohol phosphatidyltransferase family protein [Patulibacter sp.]
MGAGALNPSTGDRRPEQDDDRDPGRLRRRTRERADQVRERTRERTELVRDRTREKGERVREQTERVRDRTREQTERARMTVYRLFGIDRSGPPPPETLVGAPLRVWTIPNVVGMLRLACIPVFLVLALRSDSGTEALPAILFFAIAWSDYLDGFLARATGQYSRFGALLDPVTDRSLVLAGGIVCWQFELLPRWALAVLVIRELYMLFAGRAAIAQGIKLEINWWGRLAVWPTMSGLFAALVGLTTLGTALLLVGLAMALVATARYFRAARRIQRERAA